MDHSEAAARVVRINNSMKKSADVTIDLRQFGLMHVFTVDNVEGLSGLSSHDCDSSDSSGKNTSKNCDEESSATDAEAKDHNEAIPSRLFEPSTIIHLKVVPRDADKKYPVDADVSSTCDKNASSRSEAGDAASVNKNCSRVRSSLCEMHKEKRGWEATKECDERTNILKEFEITKQLERLRSETKRVCRRRYHTNHGKSVGNIQLNSPKSELSDKSSNDISSIFNDDVPTQDRSADPVVRSNCAEIRGNSPEKQDGSSPNSLSVKEANGGPIAEEEGKSVSFKRKQNFAFGPRSKKMKLSDRLEIFSDLSTDVCQRRRVTFSYQPGELYCDGQKARRGDEGVSRNEEVCVLVRSGQDEEEEGLSLVGREVLKLWKLSEEEIEELQKQVKEEYEHKQKEHIMPLILNMSPDQIESSYLGVRDVMKMYDITEQDSDDDAASSDEEEDEEGRFEELKSLDMLYREEFSKKCYKDLFDGSLEKDCQLSFWSREEEESDKQTDYSRTRPKRSSVDYTPTAYAFISFMEGRRSKQKLDALEPQDGNRTAKITRQGDISSSEAEEHVHRPLTNSCSGSPASNQKSIDDFISRDADDGNQTTDFNDWENEAANGTDLTTATEKLSGGQEADDDRRRGIASPVSERHQFGAGTNGRATDFESLRDSDGSERQDARTEISCGRDSNKILCDGETDKVGGRSEVATDLSPDECQTDHVDGISSRVSESKEIESPHSDQISPGNDKDTCNPSPECLENS